MNNLFEAEQFFKDCLANIGHPLQETIKFDQEWQRFPCPDSRTSKTSAAYKAHSDGVPVLKFSCNKCGLGESFVHKRGIDAVNNDKEAMSYRIKKEQQDRIDQETRNKALHYMRSQYASAQLCTTHNYLSAKGIVSIPSGFGLRLLYGNILLCPIYAIDGELISLQKIYPKSVDDKFEKRFQKGLSPKGGFLVVGEIKSNSTIYFAEGIATAITLHYAVGMPVVCVYGMHFDSIAPLVRAKYSQNKFIFCADLDFQDNKRTSQKNAESAVMKAGGYIVVPDFSCIPIDVSTNIPRSDFNDLYKLLIAIGLDHNKALSEVRNQLAIKTVMHNQILRKLLEQVTFADFVTQSGVAKYEDLTNKHYQIIVIDEILKLARVNSWGLCRRHDFIYLYNGAYWSVIDVDDLKYFLGAVAEKMGVDKYKARHFSFQEHLFKQFIATAHLPHPDYDNNTVSINLKNGTFTISPDGVGLNPFNPNDFNTYQLPFDYDPLATAPKFKQFLDQVLPDVSRQMVIAEFLGYVFVRTSVLKLEKTLVLYGSGANGKSVLYEIVRHLFGRHNVSEYSLQSLTDVKGYHRANLANKLINYASEINGRLEASIFKQLASGEPVEARLPYGHPFIMEQYAKLAFNSNELPKDVELTKAFFRRFIIIPFDITIPESEQDKQLAHKIINNELAGVFNWVLDGLQRVLANKKFTDCAAAIDACLQYETDTDNVKLFLQDKGYEPHATRFVTLQDLYVSYREFCINDGHRSLSKRNFGKRLESNGIPMGVRNIGKVFFLSNY